VAPLHISHRGGAGLAPENTLAAFRQAVEAYRTDMLELDVRASADGEVVVFHDATLERCTNGRGPVQARTLAELERLDAAFHFTPVGGAGTPLKGQGVRIPRLVEVLDAFPGLRLNVEVKSRAALGPFVALMKARPGELNRLCIGSELDELGAELHRALPEACHFFPANALGAFLMSLRTEALEDDERYTVLDMPLTWEGLTVFDETVAEVARARGKWVNVWTVDDEVAMRAAIAAGVGGVMTDRPDVLRAVLGER
jgi:glycerophosphoryl diester phosphodiesterase